MLKRRDSIVWVLIAIVWCLVKYKNNIIYIPFDFGRTRWRLLQKRVVRTTFDIYVLLYIYVPSTHAYTHVNIIFVFYYAPDNCCYQNSYYRISPLKNVLLTCIPSYFFPIQIISCYSKIWNYHTPEISTQIAARDIYTSKYFIDAQLLLMSHLSILLRITDSDCPFDLFKLFFLSTGRYKIQ
jgi:hypothetical protein